jgi:hypothetical protein
MNRLDEILDGFEAALELERELGVKSFAFDRSLLDVSSLQSKEQPQQKVAQAFSPPPSPRPESPSPRPEVQPIESPARVEESSSAEMRDFVFLHHRVLSQKGNEMMAKIIIAMKCEAGESPIVIHPPAPPAKVYVVLGSLALKMFFPEASGTPGQWISLPNGSEALITYSPEYILRFQDGAPAQVDAKRKMWAFLKGVMSRFSR